MKATLPTLHVPYVCIDVIHVCVRMCAGVHVCVHRAVQSQLSALTSLPGLHVVMTH